MNNIKRVVKITCLFVTFFALLAANTDCLAKGKVNWNNRDIKWYGYNDGLTKAKRAGKPAIIIFYADWCPYCVKFGKTFQNRKVIDATRSVIMIRINVDKYPKLSGAYDFDGQYVPRTFAVYPNGKVMHRIYPSKRSRYNVGIDPKSFLSLIRKARSRM